MTPSEEARERKAWILEELGKQNENYRGDEWCYEFHKEDVYSQKTALEALQRDGAITTLRVEKRPGFLTVDGYDALAKVPGAATFKVMHPKFENMYSEFVGKPFGQPIGKIKIIIGKRGILRADGGGEAYQMKGTGKRFAIVQLLLREKNAHANDIYEATKYEKKYGKSTVSNEVREINRLFKEALGTEQSLIESSDTSGYFLNDLAFDIEIEE